MYQYIVHIELFREEGWDSINQFNPTTLLCLSQARIESYVMVFFVFSEFSYDERWLFVLLILVELMTIIAKTFFS